MLPIPVLETIVRHGLVSEFEHLFDSKDEKQVLRLKDKSIAWMVDHEAWRLTPFTESQWALQKSDVENKKWAQVSIVNEACYLAFERLWVAEELRIYEEEILSQAWQNKDAEVEFRHTVQKTEERARNRRIKATDFSG